MARQCPQCGSVFADDVFFCGHDGMITIQEQQQGDFDPRLGTQLGDYIVAARVADGAMGRVYEGRHVDTRAQVAIKVLHEDVARDQVAVERFKREHETAEELVHANIVDVIDFGETSDGSYFMTMEYLQGEELTKALDGKPLPPARAIRALCQLCDALDSAHSFGFVHRDLKPDNVFLCHTDEGDVVKVLDFGSVKLQMETGAKLTAFGTTLGSPYYMSPEQAMGKLDVDQRTDVFAVAAIAWEIATGQVAFEGANVAQILMKIVNQDPAPPSSFNRAYPAAFDDVVLKGVAKDKTARFSSAGELATAIVAAFGLRGDHKQWAATSEADIAAALEATSPPAPAPFAAPAASTPAAASAPAAPAPAAQVGERARETHTDLAPATMTVRSSGSNRGLLFAGLAIVLVALAVAAVILLR